MEREPVVIVGAGPAGLATARELQRRGLEPLLVERGEVGASWAGYYDRLRLHSHKGVSALPGMALPAHVPDLPARDDFLAYLRAYAQRFELRIRSGTEVRSARPERGGWRLATSAGELRARALVAASGVAARPHRPPLPGADLFGGSGGALLHSSAFRRARDLPPGPALVVGFGNSGKDVALDLLDDDRAVDVAVRSGALLRPYPTSAWRSRLVAWALRTLPAWLTEPALRRVRRGYPELGLPLPDRSPLETTPVIGLEPLDAIRAGRLRVRAALEGFEDEGENERGARARFADGAHGRYAVVVLATGFRPAIGWLPPEVRVDDHGRLVDAPPGLFAVGFHYPAAEAFLQALPREARRVASEVAAWLEDEDR